MPTRRELLTAVALATAGCATTGDGGESTATPTEAGTGARTEPTPTGANGGPRVEYVLRSGGVPESFTSVTAEVQAVFVEHADDLGPCYPGVYEGPYKPTITPIATPRGGCVRSDSVSVDLTELEERVLQPAVPQAAGGHALVATAVVGTDDDGSEVTAIKNTGGATLLESDVAPEGVFGLELGIEPADGGADYDYWFIADRVDP